jgi:hypothetical protein
LQYFADNGWVSSLERSTRTEKEILLMYSAKESLIPELGEFHPRGDGFTHSYRIASCQIIPEGKQFIQEWVKGEWIFDNSWSVKSIARDCQKVSVAGRNILYL